MEFVCEKREIQSGVQMVERIVATRSTLPIIGNILFDAKKSGLKLMANNLELGIELGLNASVVKEGAVLLPAKTLSSMVSRLPETKVGFRLGEGGVVRVTYDESLFSINSLPPDEFPSLPKPKEGKNFSVSAGVLLSMIKQTIFAVSGSEEKPVLSGVLMELGRSSQTGDGSNLRMVATDGYRLAKRGEKVDLSGVGEVSVIIPARALQELSRIIEEEEGEEVKVTISAEQISFRYGEVYLVSRLIQGQFPDYKQVIPRKCSSRLQLVTKDFLNAAERAAVVASGSANITRFEVKGGKLHLLAHTPDVGSVDEVLEAEVKGNEKMQVSFNIRLITDVLKVIDTEKVVVELSEALNPGLIRPAGEENYLYLVMPIRTQETG